MLTAQIQLNLPRGKQAYFDAEIISYDRLNELFVSVLFRCPYMEYVKKVTVVILFAR